MRFELDFQQPATTIERHVSWKQEYIKLYKQFKLRLKHGNETTYRRETLRLKRKNYDPKKIDIIQRAIRRWLNRKHYKDMLEKHRQRSNIAQEILETEKTYYHGLDLLIKYFYEPLNRESLKSFSGIITETQFKDIFGDIKVPSFFLYSFNLCKHFE